MTNKTFRIKSPQTILYSQFIAFWPIGHFRQNSKYWFFAAVSQNLVEIDLLKNSSGRGSVKDKICNKKML